MATQPTIWIVQLTNGELYFFSEYSLALDSFRLTYHKVGRVDETRGATGTTISVNGVHVGSIFRVGQRLIRDRVEHF